MSFEVNAISFDAYPRCFFGRIGALPAGRGDHGLRVILAGLLRSLKGVVGWDLKERRIGLCAGEVFGFSCGFAGGRIGGFVEHFNAQFG